MFSMQAFAWQCDQHCVNNLQSNRHLCQLVADLGQATILIQGAKQVQLDQCILHGCPLQHQHAQQARSLAVCPEMIQCVS